MSCINTGENSFQTLQLQLELPTDLSVISFNGYNHDFEKFNPTLTYKGEEESQKVMRKIKRV